MKWIENPQNMSAEMNNQQVIMMEMYARELWQAVNPKQSWILLKDWERKAWRSMAMEMIGEWS